MKILEKFNDKLIRSSPLEKKMRENEPWMGCLREVDEVKVSFY
jgi:hypothetical protein